MSSANSNRGNDQERSQDEVVAFLADPRSYPGPPADVEHHETHGAHVFLAGDRAYKIKRAVTYDYMDLSTPAKRRRMIETEVTLNRRFAPDLYLGVVAITRQRDGTLALDGDGAPVEHAALMRRFPQDDLLSRMAARRAVTPTIASALADVVAKGHQTLAPLASSDADMRMSRTIDALVDQLTRIAPELDIESHCHFETLVHRQLERARHALRRRGDAGCVRRCHGDLHLNNIVMLKGVPTPFDALEFDEDLATIDTLYDLAFLLMDLMHAGLRPTANLVLDRYLWRTRSALDVEGLVALPLFLGVRSGVRALTSAQRALLGTDETRAEDARAARSYLDDAIGYLSPAPPRLIAAGGYSGTGKTTLAAALAHRLDPAPGALHVRTDLERKAMFGVEETERLPPNSYTREASRDVYTVTLGKARQALAAGHSVIIDAAFLAADERHEAEALATAANVPFTGLFLTAPRETLMNRVAQRSGDASDATADVVVRQLDLDIGAMSWRTIDAGGASDATLAQSLTVLGLTL